MVAGHARRVAARLSSETPAGHGQNSRDRAEEWIHIQYDHDRKSCMLIKVNCSVCTSSVFSCFLYH